MNSYFFFNYFISIITSISFILTKRHYNIDHTDTRIKKEKTLVFVHKMKFFSDLPGRFSFFNNLFVVTFGLFGTRLKVLFNKFFSDENILDI